MPHVHHDGEDTLTVLPDEQTAAGRLAAMEKDLPARLAALEARLDKVEERLSRP